MTNNLTMQELLEQQEQEFNQVKAGQTITGKISKITNDEVVVELNYGFDGVIKNEELNLPKGKYASDVYKVGDEITAVITRVYQKDGIINLSKLQLDEKDENSIRTFVVVLSLIAQASAIKKLVQKIVNEYHS